MTFPTLHTKGKSLNIKQTVVGIAARDFQHNSNVKSIFIVDESKNIQNKILSDFFGGVIFSSHDIFDLPETILKYPIVYGVNDTSWIQTGDIISIDNKGNIQNLFQINSTHNALFITNNCNSYCLMCSQPPRKADDISYFLELNKKLILLIPKTTESLGITGGEPTLIGKDLFHLLENITAELPKTQIHILTNGRRFAWIENVQDLKTLDTQNIVWGIPLYSDYYKMHDYIVQAREAYNQTLTGIYNLARYNQRIEIRIVLHKQTIPRLYKLAKFIYKNMPFVEHIAFMGLEYIGHTPSNDQLLWTDPYEYQNELSDAVMHLVQNGMNVSIYNSQLCLTPEYLWQYCNKSISDWKRLYIDECQNCSKEDECGGFFASALKKHSDHIHAI